MKAILLNLLLFSILNTSGQIRIEHFLDSCTKYINLKRPDEVLKFNLQAEKIKDSLKIVDQKTLYDIEFNYVWAFSKLNREQLYIKHVKKMDSLISSLKEKEASISIYRIQNLNQLAAVYIKLGLEDSAKHFFNKTLTTAKLRGEDTYISSAINNWGMFKAKNGEWDTAKAYFDRARLTLVLDSEVDSGLYCSIRDNTADYFLSKKDTLRAISMIDSNLKFLEHKAFFRESRIRWGMKLMQLYVLKKMNQKALDQIAILEQLVPNTTTEANLKNKILLIDNRLLLEKYALNENETLELLTAKIDLLEAYLEFKRETGLTSSAILSKYIQDNASNQLKKAKENLAFIKAERRRRSILYVVSTIIFIIFILILRVNQKRKIKLKERENTLQQRELQIEKLEKEKINLELDDKSKDLATVFMQTSLQKEWSHEVINELQIIRKVKHDDEKESMLKSLIRTLKQKSITYNKILTQQKGLETTDSAFYRRLNEDYPNLSRAEKETCGLIRLKLDSKEIAMIRNIHPSSVRKLRQRIRHKLQLQPEIDLYDFIQKI